MRRKIFIPLFLLGGLVLSSCSDTSSINITEVRLNRTYLKLVIDETFQLEATTIGGEKEVTYFSSDASIASVNANGLIKAISAGETTIYATANDKIASCNVKVSNAYYEAKTSHRNGDFKVDLGMGENGYSFYAPIEYSYRSLGGLLDTNDIKVNFDIPFTDGIETESKSKVEQTIENIEFVSFLTSLDKEGLLSLFDVHPSYKYRSVGYAYRSILDSINKIEDETEKENMVNSLDKEHISFGRFNDRLVSNIYSVKDNVDMVRGAYEEDIGEGTDYQKYMDIISLLSNVKLNLETLLSIDLVSILENIFPDGSFVIDEDTNSPIKIIGQIIGAIIFLTSGNTNVTYEETLLNGLKAAKFHCYLNEYGKVNLKDYSSSFGEYGKYLSYLSIDNLSFDFTLYQDSSVNAYNHLANFTFDLDLLFNEKTNIDLNIEMNLSTEIKEESTDFFKEINTRQNIFRNVIASADKYIDRIGDTISYFDNDDRRSSISLLLDKHADASMALLEFDSLNERVRFVLQEDAFDIDAIEKLYEDGLTELYKSSDNLNSMPKSANISHVYNAINNIFIYLDYKEALKRQNEDGFNVASNIIKEYLIDVKEQIQTAVNSLKTINKESSLDDIESIMLDNEALFLSSSPLTNLLPSKLLDIIPVKAKYGEEMMLTDELVTLREEVIDDEEKYDSDENLIPNLFALNKYSLNALTTYIDKLVAHYDGNDLYVRISTSASISEYASTFNRLLKIGRTLFSKTTGVITRSNISSTLKEETIAKIYDALKAKYDSLKEEGLAAFGDLKVNPNLINKAAWLAYEVPAEIHLNNIEDIENILLGVNRVDTSFLNELIEEGNKLIL